MGQWGGDHHRAHVRVARGSAKGVQNKPFNPILELTSSLEEAPDARCLFGGGPDVPFDPNTPHCIVSMVKSLRNSEGSGDGSTAILRVEDE